MLFDFQDITYSLGTPQRTLSISGKVEEGNILVVQGPSGAGKSTFFRILAKLQNATSGECYLQRVNWKEILPTEWRAKINLLFQKPVLFDGTVLDNLKKPFQTNLLSTTCFNLALVEDLLDRLLLPCNILQQDAKTLSGGEAARIVFIRALLINPLILLLDEPSSSLDIKSREAFYSVLKDWVKEPEHGVMLISHDNDFQKLGKVSFLNIES